MATASAFNALGCLFRKLEIPTIKNTIDDIVELICIAWRSPKPVVRKSVVESVVALYSILDEASLKEKVISKLTSSQKKLLESYLKLSTS
ncbi:suppressor of tub2 mutation [Basidiobolus ranarum]|uniref:Suppressor of tub2 mutation n=1 Tax=Basidiobolus ranarum TaxID=34480 RepID=A0ABR2WP84_9FUNG